jgi:DNA end-binding protein Ku
MAGDWKPGEFRDEFRERLDHVIEERLKSKGLVSNVDRKDEETDETATTNVVDFMALLQKSLASNKRTPAKAEATVAKPAKKAAKPVRKATAKAAAAKPAPAKKTTRRKSA